jgi:hypothetical protein
VQHHASAHLHGSVPRVTLMLRQLCTKFADGRRAHHLHAVCAEEQEFGGVPSSLHTADAGQVPRAVEVRTDELRY